MVNIVLKVFLAFVLACCLPQAFNWLAASFFMVIMSMILQPATFQNSLKKTSPNWRKYLKSQDLGLPSGMTIRMVLNRIGV